MKVFCKVCFCISALFLLILCSACNSVEYSVKDFANVTVVGYTEHGTLSIKVDDTAINKIYADGKKDKTAALRFAETFNFTYDGQDDEDSYFSNGDVVTINVTYDESMARALGLTFIDSSFEYTINGLEDKQELSPFDGLGVKFNGVAPYGSVQLDKSNCIQYVIDNVTFYCDNYDLSNGDKVVVRAEFNSEIAERNGYVFTEDVKKYTVVGLSKYVTTMIGVNYDSVTAKMHRMVETYVSAADTSYKSLDWYFGEEEPEEEYVEENTVDTDTDTEVDEEFDDEYVFDEEDSDSEIDNAEYYDTEEIDEFGSKVTVRKKVTDIQRIKNDFMLSDFNAKFEYSPVACYYSLNSVQYSDNLFSAVYKVTGTFVCEDSNGSGFINVGDTVVGEIYVVASLAGGSVDIKNNLYYEDTVLNNYHAYSIHSFAEYEDMTGEILGSTTYLVETLDYVEDADAYADFVKKQGSTSSKKEVSHISVDSSTDTEKQRPRSSEDETSSELEEENTDSYSEEEYYYNDESDVQYYDPDDNQYDYDNDYSYDYDDGGYDYDNNGYDEYYNDYEY